MAADLLEGALVPACLGATHTERATADGGPPLLSSLKWTVTPR